MPEALWNVTLVIIGNVMGVIIGSVITYFTATRSAKMQIEAADKQTEKQLKFQREQSQNAKLVELRTEYLHPLVEQLRELYGQSISLQKQFFSLDPDNPYNSFFGIARKQRQEVIEGCRHTLEEMASIDNKIKEIQVRISDSTLNEMLQEIGMGSIEAAISLGLPFGDGDNEKKDEDAKLRRSISEIKKITDILPKANKRIEELLSGMD